MDSGLPVGLLCSRPTRWLTPTGAFVTESTNVQRRAPYMTTLLDKTLKRELRINGRPFIVALSPEALKLTVKGKRKGLELQWDALVSGESALAVALNASLGAFDSQPGSHKEASTARSERTAPRPSTVARSAKRRS